MTSNKYLLLYAPCIPVKGYARSLIYDLQYSTYYPIPNTFFDLLLENNFCLNEDELFVNMSNEDKDILKDYIRFIIDNDLGFYTKTPDLFSRLQPRESPTAITNCVINIGYDLSLLSNIVNQLDQLLCESVELRFSVEINEDFIFQVLNYFNTSIIYNIDVMILRKSNIHHIIDNNTLLKRYPRIKRIRIYQATKNSKKYINNTIVEHIVKEYSPSECGVISHESLIFSIPFFMESQCVNTCLNKKLFLDINSGDVKNCPFSKNNLGNLKKTFLKELIKSADYQLFGGINKDSIEICKICEFRYACFDCRIYTDIGSIYSRPQKCRYNPLIAKWEGEKGYLPVGRFGDYSKLGKFKIYEDKIIKYQSIIEKME